MHWSRVSLSTKLLVSYLFVIVVGAVTLIVAADAVAPSFLAAHEAQMAGGAGMRAMMARTGILAVAAELEDAFRAAMYQALYVATAAAALVALAASFFVSRQIARPLRRMAAAIGRISAGHYAERVAISKTNLGDELGQLAASFNSMADALEQTERRRLELIGDVAHELRTPIATRREGTRLSPDGRPRPAAGPDRSGPRRSGVDQSPHQCPALHLRAGPGRAARRATRRRRGNPRA